MSSDQQFDGKASKYYLKHIFQNWNAEPFASDAYIFDDENWRRTYAPLVNQYAIINYFSLVMLILTVAIGAMSTRQQGLPCKL